MSFAQHTFELSQKQDDGASLLDHLKVVWENSGVQPKQLAEAPELPQSCIQLWNDFMELHGSRQSGFGATRITWRDIADWQEVRGVRLEPWEIDTIRMADDLWLSEFAPKPDEGDA